MTHYPGVDILPATAADPADLLRYVVETWHAETVVAHDERIYPARLPGFIAVAEGRIVGHASYRIDGDACEVTSIAAARQRGGIGTQLLGAVIEAAVASGCRRLWLTTTNDNLDALRFYQVRGFRLAALRRGAVERARLELKPEIPVVGSFGIPMRDELDLELDLRGQGPGSADHQCTA